MNVTFALITAAVAAVIGYVSLYPFRYEPGPTHVWSAFVQSVRFAPDRFDVLSNILLYLPVGFFLAAALEGIPVWLRVISSAVFGAALSMAIELTQVYDASRASSVWDFLANADGALLGAVAGASGAAFSASTFPAVMILCWLGYRGVIHWAPPLVVPPPVKAFEIFAAWLAIGLLLEQIFPVRSSRVVLAALITCVVWMRHHFTGIIWDQQEILGGALALALWCALSCAWKRRTLFVAVVFVVFIALEAFSPFRFAASPRAFGLLPFRSMIHASRESLVASTFSKVFMYGTLVWLWVRAGWPLRKVTLASALLVLALRLAQVYIPGRTAEITDAILVLLLAGGIHGMQVYLETVGDTVGDAVASSEARSAGPPG